LVVKTVSLFKKTILSKTRPEVTGNETIFTFIEEEN
jgi:hypothetical protein